MVQDMWTGWEDEGTPLHLVNVFKPISDSVMTGQGSHTQIHSGGFGTPEIQDSLLQTWQAAFRSPGLTSCLYRRNQPPRTFAGVTVQRALAQESCERMQQKEKERGKKKWGFVPVWNKLFCLVEFPMSQKPGSFCSTASCTTNLLVQLMR